MTPAERGFGWGRYCSRTMSSWRRMNSERDTPVLRAARVNNRSAVGSNAMVVAFFWASAMRVMLPQGSPPGHLPQYRP